MLISSGLLQGVAGIVLAAAAAVALPEHATGKGMGPNNDPCYPDVFTCNALCPGSQSGMICCCCWNAGGTARICTWVGAIACVPPNCL
jgi:hypothetical protein